MAYGMVSPPPLLGAPQRRQPTGGIPNSRPLPFAAQAGAKNPPAGGSPANRPVQMRPGAPKRRGQPPQGPSQGPIPPHVPSQPILDPMRFEALPETVQDFESAAALSRYPGIGQPGSERSVARRRSRGPLGGPVV